MYRVVVGAAGNVTAVTAARRPARREPSSSSAPTTGCLVMAVLDTGAAASYLDTDASGKVATTTVVTA